MAKNKYTVRLADQSVHVATGDDYVVAGDGVLTVSDGGRDVLVVRGDQWMAVQVEPAEIAPDVRFKPSKSDVRNLAVELCRIDGHGPLARYMAMARGAFDWLGADRPEPPYPLNTLDERPALPAIDRDRLALAMYGAERDLPPSSARVAFSQMSDINRKYWLDVADQVLVRLGQSAGDAR